MDSREPSTPPDWWFEHILAKATKRQPCLLACVELICERLTRRNIPFWITGGSLLGAVRHGGFIPHDDDIDFGCHRRDLELVRSVVRDELGAEPRVAYWEKIEFECFVFAPGTVGGNEHQIVVDFFFPSETEISFLRPSEVASLQLIQFSGLKVPAAADPIPYLNRVYPGWQEYAMVFSHHDTFSIKSCWKVPLDEYRALVDKLRSAGKTLV